MKWNMVRTQNIKNVAVVMIALTSVVMVYVISKAAKGDDYVQAEKIGLCLFLVIFLVLLIYIIAEITGSFTNRWNPYLNVTDKEKQYAQLSCRHQFHIDCIEQWLENKLSCPICRASPKKIPRSSKKAVLPLKTQKSKVVDSVCKLEEGESEFKSTAFECPICLAASDTASSTADQLSETTSNNIGKGPVVIQVTRL